MALLASKSKVDEWFKDDSWVYKNWVFLYQNPVWNRPIPSMASLCFYFQKACFSRWIFKPLIPLLLLSKLGMVKLAGKCGVNAEAADRWFFKLFNHNSSDSDYIAGRGTKSFFTLAGLGIGATIICSALAFIYMRFMPAWTEIHGAIVPLWFWIITTGFGTGIGVAIYLSRNQHNADRCRAEWYLVAWGVISLILCACFNPLPVFVALADTMHGIGFLIYNIGSVLWIAICGIGWFIAQLFTEWIPFVLIWAFKILIYPWGIWMVLKWLAVSIFSFLMISVLGLPLIGIFIILMILGNYAGRWVDKVSVEQKATGTYKFTESWKYDPNAKHADGHDWQTFIKMFIADVAKEYNNVIPAILKAKCETDPDIKNMWENRISTVHQNFIADDVANRIKRMIDDDIIVVPEFLKTIPFPVFESFRQRILFGQKKSKNGMGFSTWKRIERSGLCASYFLSSMVSIHRRSWVNIICVSPKMTEEMANKMIDSFTELVNDYFAVTIGMGRMKDGVMIHSSDSKLNIDDVIDSFWIDNGIKKMFLSECKFYAERTDKQKRFDAMCSKFSGMVAMIFDFTLGNLFRGIWFCICKIWKAGCFAWDKLSTACKSIWKFICIVTKNICHQCSIGGEYMWILLKAMKQGACPVKPIEHVQGGYMDKLTQANPENTNTVTNTSTATATNITAN